MDRPQHDAAQNDHEHGDPQLQLQGHEQVDEDDAQQGEHRADREVDAAGDDDEALADREEAEQADQVRRIREVDRRDEARVQDGDDKAHNDDQEKEPEILFQHAPDPPSSISLLPTASPPPSSPLN